MHRIVTWADLMLEIPGFGSVMYDFFFFFFLFVFIYVTLAYRMSVKSPFFKTVFMC